MGRAIFMSSIPVDAENIEDACFHVKGFRSLQDFNIQLTPGLNVLLGSNGSGKTNFIDFIDFMSLLVTDNVSTAVSASGGVARVFSQETLKRKMPRVTAKITGTADLTGYLSSSHKNVKFRFEYEVDIRYSKFHTAVYVANERVRFKNLYREKPSADSFSTVGSMEIHRFSPLVDEEVRWTVGAYLLSNSTRNPLRHVHPHRLPPLSSRGLSAGEQRAQLLSQAPATSPDESILSVRSSFPALDAIRFAIARGRAFNLNPEKARTPDDISTSPFIKPDGSGLSATLYQMQQLKRATDRQALARRRFPKDSLDTIIGWTKLVLPELHDIVAVADPHSGKYIAYLVVGDEYESLRIPLRATSDGTLKWLAFVCLAVAQGAEYTFEEPENYLHPKMQRNLIALLRESIEDLETARRFIVSTHSETIINQCRPEEIILFSFERGQTLCKRVSNTKSLVDQVNRTGFGLGHYYAMNVVR